MFYRSPSLFFKRFLQAPALLKAVNSSERIRVVDLGILLNYLRERCAIEDLFDENEDVGKKASSSGVESST
ncbi:hypothetical protein YC2023_116107 [Brassica napus]